MMDQVSARQNNTIMTVPRRPENQILNACTLNEMNGHNLNSKESAYARTYIVGRFSFVYII